MNVRLTRSGGNEAAIITTKYTKHTKTEPLQDWANHGIL